MQGIQIEVACETFRVLDVHVVFIGAAISLAGTALYARDTFRGLTQPNRVTWLLWFIAPMLAFADEVSQGVGLQSLMAFVLGFGPLLVLIASFMNPHAVWKIGPFDVACGIASAGGLTVWLVTQNDTVALASFMAADFLAGLPTLIKAWREPETESVSAYLGGFINASLTLSTVTVWTTAEVAFPIQIIIFNFVQVVLIGGRLGPRLRGVPAPGQNDVGERVIAPRRGEGTNGG